MTADVTPSVVPVHFLGPPFSEGVVAIGFTYPLRRVLTLLLLAAVSMSRDMELQEVRSLLEASSVGRGYVLLVVVVALPRLVEIRALSGPSLAVILRVPFLFVLRLLLA